MLPQKILCKATEYYFLLKLLHLILFHEMKIKHNFRSMTINRNLTESFTSCTLSKMAASKP